MLYLFTVSLILKGCLSLENFPYSLTEHAERRISERSINPEWINRVLTNPQKIEPDPEDSELCHASGTIPEYGNRVLRVVYNETVSPWRIVTAHFDRKLKGKL